VFQRRKFFQGRSIRGGEIKDLSWFGPDGEEMSDEAWNAGYVKCLGVRLAGDTIPETDERGQPLVGDTLMLLLNAHHEAIAFRLPVGKGKIRWERVLDTESPANEAAVELEPAAEYALAGRSFVVLRCIPEEEVLAPEPQVEVARKDNPPATQVDPNATQQLTLNTKKSLSI
jgi:glycogen operon protein